VRISPSHTDLFQIDRHAAIIDGPIVSAQRQDGKMMRVERIRISYRWIGAWKTDKYSVDISGPVLKKDGTDSQLDATIHYWYGAQPEWVRAIIDGLRPDTAPTYSSDVFEVTE
jgi:hypothetical protein